MRQRLLTLIILGVVIYTALVAVLFDLRGILIGLGAIVALGLGLLLLWGIYALIMRFIRFIRNADYYLEVEKHIDSNDSYTRSFNRRRRARETDSEDKDAARRRAMARRRPVSTSSSYVDLKQRVQNRISNALHIETVSRNEATRYAQTMTIFNNVLAEENMVLSRQERQRLLDSVYAEIFSLGPLHELMSNPDIQFIYVNSPREVFIKQINQEKVRAAISFEDKAHFARIANRIFAEAETKTSDTDTIKEGRYQDFHFKILTSPILFDTTIQLQRVHNPSNQLQALINNMTLSADAAGYLSTAIKERRNMLIVGSTGTGKTHLINVLVNLIEAKDRVITLSQALDIHLPLSNDIRLTLDPSSPNMTMPSLLQLAETLPADRFIIDTLDRTFAAAAFQSLTRGRKGSIFTATINSEDNLIENLQQLCLNPEGHPYSIDSLKSLLSHTIDIVIMLDRLQDGSRRVMTISEYIVSDTGMYHLTPRFTRSQSSVVQNGKIVSDLVSEL